MISRICFLENRRNQIGIRARFLYFHWNHTRDSLIMIPEVAGITCENVRACSHCSVCAMVWTILVALMWLNPLLCTLWTVLCLLVAVHRVLSAFAVSFAALVHTSKIVIRKYTTNDANLLSAMRCGTERRNLQNSALRKVRRHVVSFATGYFVIPAATYCQEAETTQSRSYRLPHVTPHRAWCTA